MASSYGDAVSDFNLDFLHENNVVTVDLESKQAKLRCALVIVKKKVTATSSLIDKYRRLKEARDQLEKNLLESKEECKQVCLNHNNTLKKFTKLEEIERNLRSANQELEERCEIADTRYNGLQSHTNQLQLLVKDNETKFDALEIEKQLQKSKINKIEKQITSLAQEKDVIMQHVLLMKDIILGKKKLNKKFKKVLKKYKGKAEDGGHASESNSDAESWQGDAFTECGTPETTALELESDILEPEKSLKIETITSPYRENLNSDIPHQHTDLDHDSDGSSKIGLSVDTGRGSSLAFSDSEKCFLSPDQFSDDNLPNSGCDANNTATVSHSDRTTSPADLPSLQTTSRKSIFDDPMEIDIITKPSEQHKPETSEHHTLPLDLETVTNAERLVIDSPTDQSDDVTNQFEEETYNSFLKPQVPTLQNTRKNEMKTLEFYNITKLISDEENDNDYEVSTILNNIKLHYSIMSPLPPSPTSMSGCSATGTTNRNLSLEVVESSTDHKENALNLFTLNNKVMGMGSNMELMILMLKRLEKKIDKYRKENKEKKTRKHDKPGLSQKQVERHSEEPSLINKKFEKDLAGTVKKPFLTIRESVSDKEIPSEMQTQPFVGENHKKPLKEFERSTSPVYSYRDRDNTVIDAFIVGKEVETDKIPEEDKHLIRLSDLCDDTATIANIDDNEPSELYVYDKPCECTSVINTPINSHQNEGRVAENMFIEEPALTDNKSLEEENVTSVISTSINSDQNEGRVAENMFIEESSLTDDKRFEVENVTSVISTSISSDQNEGSIAENMFIEESSLTDDKRFEVENVTSVTSTSINSDQKEGREAENMFVEDPALTDNKSLEVENVTSVINASINSHQNEGRVGENVFIEEPELTDDKSLEVENVTPVKNTSIDLSRVLAVRVEKTLFVDPAVSEKKSLAIENVRGPVEQGTLFNNCCDINLKLDDVCNNNHTPKSCRKTKLTKLQKIRQKLQPKNKIKVGEAPKKLRPKNVWSNLAGQTEMNNKAVYEKALAVVAELRAKQKIKKENTFIARSGRVHTRSERNDVTPELEVPKLKIRQSPRLHSVSDDDKEIRTPPKGQRNKGKKEINMSPSECESNSITTRSRSKGIVNTHIKKPSVALKENFKDIINGSLSAVQQSKKVVSIDGATMISPENSSLKRFCYDTSELETNRKLRSLNGKQPLPETGTMSKIEICGRDNKIAEINRNTSPEKSTVYQNKVQNINLNLSCKDYGDMDMFTETIETVAEQNTVSDCINHPQDSILCRMIKKHVRNNKFRQNTISEEVTVSICKKLEQSIATIKELPEGQRQFEINQLVDDIRSLPYEHFLSGLTKFLIEPDRKSELYNKNSPPLLPPTTKTEQILLNVISQVRTSWAPVDIVNEIMATIEFSLFRLGQAPDFDAIESLSHFYAVLCRLSQDQNRLRLFILDAMYCLAFKAIPLIKTCIEAWMHVLPLAHMGIAHSPLVICIVYLLHYYKGEDKYNRVQDIRFLLKKRYSFDMTEWNEAKILDLLKNLTLELPDDQYEKKMLRTAFVILAKRQGPNWCQVNLIDKILLPLIGEKDLPGRVKDFCVSMLGPLMKPYPRDGMNVHCELMLNKLLGMLEQKCSQKMHEDIFTSLLYLERRFPDRITQALLSWRTQGEISQQFEERLSDLVRHKTIKEWKHKLAELTN